MKYSKCIPYLILLLLYTSCVKEVESGLDSLPAQPVLNGILMADNQAWVHLSYTTRFDTENFLGIENASVTLFEDGQFFEELTHHGEGYYLSEKVVSAGSEYECLVEIPNYGQLVAKDKIPEVVLFENEKLLRYGVPNDEGVPQPYVTIDILHDPNQQKYFDFSIFIYDETNGMRQSHIVSPFDNAVMNEGLEINLFSNASMSQTPYTFQSHLYVSSFGCSNLGCEATLYPTIVELKTISYHLYRFLQQAYLQEQGRFPEFGLGVPLAVNAYSNVENGRGIFAGYSFIRSDTIQPPPRNF